MALAVEWIEDEDRFASMAEEWDRLLPDDGTPFDLHCWYASWWKAFGGSSQLAVCGVRRHGELIGVFPLRRHGDRLTALANEHSSCFRPLARDAEAMDELVAAVLAERPADFELNGLPAGDRFLERLQSGVREGRRIPLVELEYRSPAIDTNGDFEAWRQLSKPRWGAPLERFRRKMGRDHEAEFAIVEPPADVEAELADGFRVEASGWKGLEGTAILSAPETEAFYWNVGRAFHRRGELRLSRVVLDGATAAFDFCLLHRGRLYLLKTGYDERFRRLAPGLVMRLSIVERCFELELESHELLGRESEWKNKFANASREFVVLRTYARSPVGACRCVYRAALRPRLKRAYRRLQASAGVLGARPGARR